MECLGGFVAQLEPEPGRELCDRLRHYHLPPIQPMPFTIYDTCSQFNVNLQFIVNSIYTLFLYIYHVFICFLHALIGIYDAFLSIDHV